MQKVDLSTYLYSFADITQVEVKDHITGEVLFSGYADNVVQQIQKDDTHEYSVTLGRSITYSMISRGKLIVYPDIDGE